MDGAKDENMKTICICQRGRELPYLRFKRLTDEIILLDKFSDIIKRENQKKLQQFNTIMIAHRALTAYLGYDNIENNLDGTYLRKQTTLACRRTDYNKKPVLTSLKGQKSNIPGSTKDLQILMVQH